TLIIPIAVHTPTPTLFPYTTLFRSMTETGGSSDAGRDVASTEAAARDATVEVGGGDASFDLAVTESGPEAPSARDAASDAETDRSEEHTSELQSQSNLVCRLLLEKK